MRTKPTKEQLQCKYEDAKREAEQWRQSLQAMTKERDAWRREAASWKTLSKMLIAGIRKTGANLNAIVDAMPVD